MKSIFRPALVLFAALTVICGVLYPFAITGIGQVAFAAQAGGSLVYRNNQRDGQPVGSALIGQAFSSPRYFWGRPSATGPMPNNATASGGSNLGPANPAQIDAVKGRIEALKAADPANAAADSGRSGDRFRQRTGPGDQPGWRLLPGRTHCA